MSIVAIKLLTDPTEQAAAYRLRYEVAYEEEHDERYANHITREWRDANDVIYSLLFGAFDGPELVGTLRLTARRSQTLIGDEFYQWDKLADALVVPREGVILRVGVMDRVFVAMRYRRSGVMRMMVGALCSRARADCISYVVCAAAVENYRSHISLETLGFRPYGEPCGAGAWRGQHFVLRTDEA